jgi:polar amino acid transport system substrate-binding protein
MNEYESNAVLLVSGVALSRFVRPALLGALLLLALPSTLQAGVLERVEASGVLRAGTRADVAPFAFLDQGGNPVGFSVDLLDEIRAALSERFGRTIALDLSVVTTTNRIDAVESGDLDIICEVTTPTWDREEHVDFSLPFFRDGTRVLAFRETLNSVSELQDMTIGVAEGTTTAAILGETVPGIETRTYPSMDATFAALRRGEVQGVANVGVILLGLSRQLTPDQSVVLLPRTEPLGSETMACILPENDSRWRDFVNFTLTDLMEGLADYRGRYMELYDKWFGRDGVLTYPLDRSTRDYLLHGDIWTALHAAELE